MEETNSIRGRTRRRLSQDEPFLHDLREDDSRRVRNGFESGMRRERQHSPPVRSVVAEGL